MTGYFIFFTLIFLCSLIKNKEWMLKLMFIIIAVFSSIRFGIGYDYYSYLDLATNESFTASKIELVPRLMAGASRATIPFLFFVLSSFFISFFYYLGLKKYDGEYLPAVIFYLCFPFLFMDQLGIIRQGMAASVVFFASSLDQSKIIRRCLLIALAFSCHSSAIVGVLLLLPWNKLTPERLWMILVSSFFIGVVIVKLILGILAMISIGGVNARAEEYLSNESGGEGRLIQYLIYLIAIFCISNYNAIVSYSSRNGYYVGLVVLGASLFALFSFNDTVAKRLCMFFFSSTIFVVPYLVRAMGISLRIFYVLCIILFSLLIFVGRNNSRLEDPPGYSVTYPYRTIFGYNL